jgi:hypothetical protein
VLNHLDASSGPGLVPARRPRGLIVTAALVGVLLFHLVSIASGKVAESGGLGWDGQEYARIATEGWSEGGATSRTRPLIPLLARLPLALGLGIVASFQLLNYLYAFVVYLAAGLILDRYGAPPRVTFVLVANLALCIATSKLFAFYPVLIDFGALALASVAFYLILADRRWLAAGACVLTAASREFGVVVALYGMHRSMRLGRPAYETALTYLPSVAATLLIRWWVLSTVDAGDRPPISVAELAGNVFLLGSPEFLATFAYFAIVLFGGMTALLAVVPRWSIGRIREEPELGTYLLVCGALAALAGLDIWRYSAFALPVILALIGPYFLGADPAVVKRMLVAITMITLVTQRPFDLMNTDLYFREWFPLYRNGDPAEVVAVWNARFASLALLMAALFLAVRWNWSPARAGMRASPEAP